MSLSKLLMAGFLSIPLVLTGCGGGGGGGGDGSTGSSSSNNGGGSGEPLPAPANRFVLSGNSDGTISIFRSNNVAGYATAMAYFNAGDGFAIQDLIFDATNNRAIAITDRQIIVLGFDVDIGVITLLDARSTSTNSSHVTLNAAGTAAYVASGSGSNQHVDFFAISANGTLSPIVATPLTIDPDYIKINPAGTRLYVVSRSDDQILVFNINADGSLAATPTTVNTGQNPTSIGFSNDGTTAYVTRQDNNEDLVMYSVSANGGLNQITTLNNSNSPVDQVLSADGLNLYVVDSSNSSVNHYTVDTDTGMPTFVSSTNMSFNATDIAMSRTGSELYVGHDEDDLVSTLTIDSSTGALTVANFVRAFSSVRAVTAIGGAGALQPTVTFLMVPDSGGLRRFSVDTNGLLTLAIAENNTGALIDGEVEIDYPKSLMFGAGETTSPANTDFVTSYAFDPTTGATSPVSEIDVTIDADSSFQRVELGRSGRFIYVLDENIFSSTTVPAPRGTLYTYSIANNGTITTTPPIDSDSVGEGPENLSMHHAGRYIYSVDSFGDRISVFEINESTGSLSSKGTITPGGNGTGVGRPIDVRFHPNGRFAYVILQDDSEVVRYPVNINGSFDNNPSRLSLPQNNGTSVEPRAIAVHPAGRLVYVAEGSGGPNGISLLEVNQTDYSLSFNSRINLSANPSWISIDPLGHFLYVRYSGDGSVQVFTIDATTGVLTDSGQTVAAGSDGGFLPTTTLVAPLK